MQCVNSVPRSYAGAVFAQKDYSSSWALARMEYGYCTPICKSRARWVCEILHQRKPDTGPAQPGAYLLLIELTKVTDVKLSKVPNISLVAGHYLYAGSAYGPGGLKARIARHMRRAKVQRWHIDQLTKTGVRGAWIFPGSNECDLVEMNSALPVPIIGFGSADCKRCRSHLLGPSTAIRHLTHRIEVKVAQPSRGLGAFQEGSN